MENKKYYVVDEEDLFNKEIWQIGCNGGVCLETEGFKGTEHEGTDVCEDGCVLDKPVSNTLILEALHDYRPWKTGVPEIGGEYETTITYLGGQSIVQRLAFKPFAGGWQIKNGNVIAFRELPPPYEIKK